MGCLLTERPGGRGGKNRRGSNRPAEFEIPAYVEPLSKSDNRWVAVKPTSEEEQVIKKFGLVLNIITEEKLDRLVKKVIGMNITSAVVLREMAVKTIEKAMDDSIYAKLFAKFALKLDIKVTPEDKPLSFTDILVPECERLFPVLLEGKELQHKIEDESKASDPEEIEYRRLKHKRHIVGFMTFIGELFNLKICPPTVLSACIESLTSQSTDAASEEIVDCVVILLQSTGPNLSTSCPDVLNKTFAHLNKLLSTPGLPLRIKFLLQDLMALRDNKCVDVIVLIRLDQCLQVACPFVTEEEAGA